MGGGEKGGVGLCDYPGYYGRVCASFMGEIFDRVVTCYSYSVLSSFFFFFFLGAVRTMR